MRPGVLRGPFALLRAILLLVCLLLAWVSPRHLEALPFIGGLAVAAVFAYVSPAFERYFAFLGLMTASVAIPLTGGGSSPMLPYLLAPGLTLALTRGLRGLATGGLIAAIILAAEPFAPGLPRNEDYAVAAVEWLLLMVLLGLVGHFSQRLTMAAVEPNHDLFAQVYDVLEQLHGLTQRLPGGLDVPATAEALLERCAAGLPQVMGAVLVHTGGTSLVPVAVMGARRVPWRTPLSHEGPLRTAWTSGQPVVDVRAPDSHGRRTGSALLAQPIGTSDTPFGLLVLESRDTEAFPPAERARIAEEAQRSASQLEAALLFEEVRLAASLEERDRLAKEMHDGIAQELAFVGYRLDALRAKAAKVNPELALEVNEVRGDLTSLISNLRLSITELRNSVRSDQGLGSVMTTYLQALCAGTPIKLTLSINETGFRLPADLEVALLQAARAFGQEVRRSGAQALSVDLVVDPPSAELHMACDGSTFTPKLDGIHDVLSRAGGVVTTSQSPSGGPRLGVILRGGPIEHPRAVGGRSRVDQARSPSSVRADG